MTCRRPRYPPHAHTVKCLMPVMISPRSARDSLRVPCLQLSGPHLKCTFSQHTLRGGVPLKLGGLLISASNLSSRPDQNGPRPQVQRSRAKGPEPQEKTWLSQLGQVAPVAQVGKGSFRWGRGDVVRWSGPSVCLPACLPASSCSSSSSALGIPSPSSSARGVCAVVVGLWGGLPPMPSLPGQFALHLSAPNNSPHFTAVPSLDGHARNTGL